MHKHQLTLPGLRASRPERRARARRDWTAAEFKRALERNGFEHFGGLRFADVSGATDLIFTGIVARTVPVRIARRATLAKLLRERAAAAENNVRTACQNHRPKVRIGC